MEDVQFQPDPRPPTEIKRLQSLEKETIAAWEKGFDSQPYPSLYPRYPYLCLDRLLSEISGNYVLVKLQSDPSHFL